jgi:hypothetical protein
MGWKWEVSMVKRKNRSGLTSNPLRKSVGTGIPFQNQSALLGRSNVSRSGRSGLAVAAGSGKKGSGGGSGEGGDFDEFHVFGIV